MNPMLFGIDIPDAKKPIINSLFAYPLEENSQINNSQLRTKIRLTKIGDGIYKAEDFTAFGTIGFGVSTEDQLDSALNKNGIYSIETKLNATKKFEVRFDKFSFDETRYLNRYIDYGYFQTEKSRIQKLFREINNPLSVIVDEDNNGFIDVKEGNDYSLLITVKDFKGNISSIIIPFKGEQKPIHFRNEIPENSEFVHWNHSHSITKGKFNIYIPSGSLYDDTYLEVSASENVLKLHHNEVPLHKNISISADISDFPESDYDKLYIGKLNYRNLPSYVTTIRKGEKLTASTRDFGDYTIAYDTIAPVIQPINFSDGKWINDQKTLRIKITDDRSGISSYRATINGKFILMEYEYKTNTLTYDFEDNINDSTENNLKLIVLDNVGNSATFEAKFFRKQT